MAYFAIHCQWFCDWLGAFRSNAVVCQFLAHHNSFQPSMMWNQKLCKSRFRSVVLTFNDSLNTFAPSSPNLLSVIKQQSIVTVLFNHKLHWIHKLYNSSVVKVVFDFSISLNATAPSIPIVSSVHHSSNSFHTHSFQTMCHVLSHCAEQKNPKWCCVSKHQPKQLFQCFQSLALSFIVWFLVVFISTMNVFVFQTIQFHLLFTFCIAFPQCFQCSFFLFSFCQSVFHSPTSNNVFPNHCDEFLTLKFKCDKSRVHHESITQSLHFLITNLVGCSFHLHSEWLHFGASFTTHIQPKTLSWLCVASAFHSVPLHLQSQMCFLSQIRSVNPVSTLSCLCDILTIKFQFSQWFIHHQSIAQCLHSFITNLVACDYVVVNCVECQSLMKWISPTSHSVFKIVLALSESPSAFAPSFPISLSENKNETHDVNPFIFVFLFFFYSLCR